MAYNIFSDPDYIPQLPPDKYRKARNKASNYTKKPEVRRAVFSRDGYACVECGATENLTVDHILSVVRGGSNHLSNLQTLCRSCNSKKAP